MRKVKAVVSVVKEFKEKTATFVVFAAVPCPVFGIKIAYDEER